MPAKSSRPLVKKTMKLYEGQAEELDLFYPKAGGYSAVIRAIIDEHLKKLNAKMSQDELNVEVSLPPKGNVK